jgi:hypothetical protein
MKTEDRIIEVANGVRDLLIEKNRAYGDSALKPGNIFAKGSAVENICARIDDKLFRIKNKGLNDLTEDTVQDLIGYLILLKIALQDERNNLSESVRQEPELHKSGNSTTADSLWQTGYTYSASEGWRQKGEDDPSDCIIFR